MTDDLEKLIPVPTSLEIRGEVLDIPLLKVGKLSTVITIITPMLGDLPKAGDTPSRNPIDFLSLVTNHTDSVISLLSVLISKERAWVEDLYVDELVTLLAALVEVNLDFFIQRVLPSVSGAMGRLGAGLQKTTGLTGGLPFKV